MLVWIADTQNTRRTVDSQGLVSHVRHLVKYSPRDSLTPFRGFLEEKSESNSMLNLARTAYLEVPFRYRQAVSDSHPVSMHLKVRRAAGIKFNL
jgi:hypothetical protein